MNYLIRSLVLINLALIAQLQGINIILKNDTKDQIEVLLFNKILNTGPFLLKFLDYKEEAYARMPNYIKGSNLLLNPATYEISTLKSDVIPLDSHVRSAKPDNRSILIRFSQPRNTITYSIELVSPDYNIIFENELRDFFVNMEYKRAPIKKLPFEEKAVISEENDEAIEKSTLPTFQILDYNNDKLKTFSKKTTPAFYDSISKNRWRAKKESKDIIVTFRRGFLGHITYSIHLAPHRPRNTLEHVIEKPVEVEIHPAVDEKNINIVSSKIKPINRRIPQQPFINHL